MGQSTPSLYFKFLVAGVALGIGAAICFLWPNVDEAVETPSEDKSELVAEELELPPVDPGPFLNASAEAKFVGSQSCAECHPEIHRSFQQTTHSQTLQLVSANLNLPEGSIQHAATGRCYDISLKKDELRHRSTIRPEGRSETVLSDFPMKYVIGSGHLGRTFVFEADGFLIQSPVTWYSLPAEWDMSPGYDQPRHQAFERPIDGGCLGCHAGHFEMVDNGFHKVRFHENSIGCERCHGPGSMHVAKQTAGETDGSDPTIAHPAKLSRELQEAICSRCHIENSAMGKVRGRNVDDFRPGMRLTDFRVHHKMDSAESKTVVGHVEQLRRSRCYIEDATLTCTTCHDPHQREIAASRREALFRRKCLGCHEQEACTKPHAERLKESPSDNCTRCHMSGTETDIPHVPATNHRIGIFRNDGAKLEESLAKLVPIADSSQLPKIEADRCRGLAWLQLSQELPSRGAQQACRERAKKILRDVYGRGVRDPELLVALARLELREDSRQAIRLLEAALNHPDGLRAMDRVNALATVSNALMGLNQATQTRRPLEELVTLIRSADAWFTLGQCRLQTGNLPGAFEAFEKAVEIAPHRSDFHSYLEKLNVAHGNTKQAAEHHERAIDLRKVSVYQSK